jgi:hypothetical protein
MDPRPIGWTLDQFTHLHPGFVAVLVPALLEADARQLRVRYRSGYRGNAEQRSLHDSFEARLAAFDRGELKAKPLPAAPAGASAHNFALCSVDVAHPIGGADECPECGAAVTPASVACDVQILGPNGQPIPSGGDAPLEQRSHEWQQWAAILDRHPELRDGGDYASRKDPVHVEWIRWDYKTHALGAPRDEDLQTPVAIDSATQLESTGSSEGEVTVPPAAPRPKRGGGRRGPPPVQS